ncbi:hypothetical protein CXB51_028439 [Gossypium anomalum]|uniref:Pentatricopeptide repeat-containing protein n=1 Tax=Gossypium anomalum TaxID=47600 RepID=A0A8J5YAI5_9ROSI|nr:hypothetical protein CXB51_028439 [Gossypium anomalum]
MRVLKLISAQSDPLLAKEIFDVSTTQPNFYHSYSSFLVLILKLDLSKHFSLVDDLLVRLKFNQYRVTPTLFSYLIKIYAEADLLERALNVFYKMLEFNVKALPKHLNRIIELLVSHCNFIMLAFDLFKIAHKYNVFPNTKSYNILMGVFCLNGDLSIVKSKVNRDVDLLEDMLNKGFVPNSLSYTTLLNSLYRKKKLREAYKLLCRMKVKGCNHGIVHYNTVILGFCREGKAMDAVKFLHNYYSGRNNINCWEILDFRITLSLDINGITLVYTTTTLDALTTNCLLVITFFSVVLLRWSPWEIQEIEGSVLLRQQWRKVTEEEAKNQTPPN